MKSRNQAVELLQSGGWCLRKFLLQKGLYNASRSTLADIFASKVAGAEGRVSLPGFKSFCGSASYVACRTLAPRIHELRAGTGRQAMHLGIHFAGSIFCVHHASLRLCLLDLWGRWVPPFAF